MRWRTIQARLTPPVEATIEASATARAGPVVPLVAASRRGILNIMPAMKMTFHFLKATTRKGRLTRTLGRISPRRTTILQATMHPT